MRYVDDAHAPLRVRKEHYLEAIYSLGDGVTLSRLARSLGVKPSSALKVVRAGGGGACDVQRQEGPPPHRDRPEARGGAEPDPQKP
jgi:hypothetical protein